MECTATQKIEFVPRIVDERVDNSLGRVKSRRRVERRIGNQILENADSRLRDVDSDAGDDNASVIHVKSAQVMLDGTERRSRNKLIRSSYPPRAWDSQGPGTLHSHTIHGFTLRSMHTSPGASGLLAIRVNSGGSAHQSGIKPGDIITRCNGVQVLNHQQLHDAIGKDTRQMTLTIYRPYTRTHMTKELNVNAASGKY
eukprot:NODE_7740_length_746_cov_6.025682_g7490_i0.p1 GENE.NODE_7740_length_746_cov_6.025682_g7490_i0~~NODE_7740_length_746_cov_6.025682_g7490_i0.p1  ORF type:complete len:198 (-),score=12.68 NODE_7740_length_746_cov_6.025682_g7490_i0:151-744(-)